MRLIFDYKGYGIFSFLCIDFYKVVKINKEDLKSRASSSLKSTQYRLVYLPKNHSIEYWAVYGVNVELDSNRNVTRVNSSNFHAESMSTAGYIRNITTSTTISLRNIVNMNVFYTAVKQVGMDIGGIVLPIDFSTTVSGYVSFLFI